MTSHEKDQLEEIAILVRGLNTFFMEPKAPGMPSRAEEIDSLLDTVRAGKLTYRVVLAILALVAAFGASWATFSGWWK